MAVVACVRCGGYTDLDYAVENVVFTKYDAICVDCIEEHEICPECEEPKPECPRVQAGMKCGQCAYGLEYERPI